MPSRFVHELNIGNVKIKNNLVLAPLAGFTDVAFRKLCRECGIGLTVTEMVSVNGLKYRNEKTETLLRRAENELPCAVQLFGSDPEVFYRVIEGDDKLSEFEIIDINMGCPMPKVTKLGAGSALLKDTARASEIVRACVEAGGGRPVTVKMRLGIERISGAVAFAESLQKAGAAAVTVHGRTVKQLYGGLADWTAIAEIKAALEIPVIGNGDIATVEDFDEKVASSGVDGVMLGRGCIGRPQLISEILGLPSASRADTALKHAKYMKDFFSDRYAAVNFRKHAPHYLKGIAGSRELKQKLSAASSFDELQSLLKEIR